jgi:hypothetical protein
MASPTIRAGVRTGRLSLDRMAGLYFFSDVSRQSLMIDHF